MKKKIKIEVTEQELTFLIANTEAFIAAINEARSRSAIEKDPLPGADDVLELNIGLLKKLQRKIKKPVIEIQDDMIIEEPTNLSDVLNKK